MQQSVFLLHFFLVFSSSLLLAEKKAPLESDKQCGQKPCRITINFPFDERQLIIKKRIKNKKEEMALRVSYPQGMENICDYHPLTDYHLREKKLYEKSAYLTLWDTFIGGTAALLFWKYPRVLQRNFLRSMQEYMSALGNKLPQSILPIGMALFTNPKDYNPFRPLEKAWHIRKIRKIAKGTLDTAILNEDPDKFIKNIKKGINKDVKNPIYGSDLKD